MMDQLGISEAQVWSPSGSENAPNPANYDESKGLNPYPNVPDPLVMNDGTKVTTAAMWNEQRRPQLVEMLSKYVYGFVPPNVPKVSWTVTAVDHEMIGFTPVTATDLIGTVDNSAYPAISVHIHMTLVTPENVHRPVPVLMMFGRAGFPNPHEPSQAEFDRINAAYKAMLIQQDPSLKDVFISEPTCSWNCPFKPTPFQFPQMNADGEIRPNTWQLVAAGWGFALLDPASVQADNGAGLTRGIIGLGQQRPAAPARRLGRPSRALGRGVPAARSTISKPIPPSTRSTSASKASHVTARPRSSPWLSISASRWRSSAPPAKAVPRCCAATSARPSKVLLTMSNSLDGRRIMKYGARNPTATPARSRGPNEFSSRSSRASLPTFIKATAPMKGDAKWPDHQAVGWQRLMPAGSTAACAVLMFKVTIARTLCRP